jgi:hypothetical protein
MKKHKSEVKQNDSLGTKLRKIEEIKKLYESLRAEMRNQWNRDLPLEELLFDRWERAERLGFGKGTSIYHNSYVYGDVKVGRNTWIGPFTVLDGSGGLKIGSIAQFQQECKSILMTLYNGRLRVENPPMTLRP